MIYQAIKLYHGIGIMQKIGCFSVNWALVEGKVQIEGEVIHVVVQRCMNMSGLFDKVPASAKVARAADDRHEEQTNSGSKRLTVKGSVKKVLPKGRNFH